MTTLSIENLRTNGVWASVEAEYAALENETLTSETIENWMARWSKLIDLVEEIASELYIRITTNTADEDAAAKWQQFTSHDEPNYRAATQRLNQKLLNSGLQPPNFSLQIRHLAGHVHIFRDENLPLITEEETLRVAYQKMIGAQTAHWRGKDLPLMSFNPILLDPDRAVREEAWHLIAKRRLQDRDQSSEIWAKLVQVRQKIADNADLPDFRAYRWFEEGRYDYTPDDCKAFAESVAEVIVPAVTRLNEKRRKALGVETLRAWDMGVEPSTEAPLKPFATGEQLAERMSQIFKRMDDHLGQYYDVLYKGGRLDLDNRLNKAPGGYCIWSELEVPFIFMNASGTQNDIVTLAHEAGHSFHNFETRHIAYHHQLRPGREFTETASTTMELLTMPYWEGTYYDGRDAARAQLQYFNAALPFFPLVAVVDLFQHWVYENPGLAQDAANCDAQWDSLRKRFLPDIDWAGLEVFGMTQWQHTPRHIFLSPFYYIEYALSKLGALQIWQYSLKDEAGAISGYRKALSHGGMIPLAELFKVAHGRFAFDADTLRETVNVIEWRIAELEATLG